jgi:hypothetical protein
VHLIEPELESLVISLIFYIFRSEAPLKSVVLKNMQGHRRRNEKTTLMYSLALAFLIFTGTAFNLQTSTIAQLLASIFGSDISISIPNSQLGKFFHFTILLLNSFARFLYFTCVSVVPFLLISKIINFITIIYL